MARASAQIQLQLPVPPSLNPSAPVWMPGMPIPIMQGSPVVMEPTRTVTQFVPVPYPVPECFWHEHAPPVERGRWAQAVMGMHHNHDPRVMTAPPPPFNVCDVRWPALRDVRQHQRR